MKNYIKLNLLFVVLVSIMLACGNADNPTSDDNYSSSVIPSDVTKLYIEKGNNTSKNVILYCQGGPNSDLGFDELEPFDLDENRLIYVHQANTLNQNVLNDDNHELTIEEAEKENNISIEILYKVAKHFIDSGNKVYIIGHSFGSFLLSSFIYKKELAITKYLIMGGRLNINQIVWEGLRDGKFFTFPDSLTPQESPLPLDATDKQKKQQKDSSKLLAVFGMNRYTELLKDKNLSNVIYAYGTNDKVLGRLTLPEINFLKEKNAEVIKLEDGGHSSMFDILNALILKEKLLAIN